MDRHEHRSIVGFDYSVFATNSILREDVNGIAEQYRKLVSIIGDNNPMYRTFGMFDDELFGALRLFGERILKFFDDIEHGVTPEALSEIERSDARLQLPVLLMMRRVYHLAHDVFMHYQEARKEMEENGFPDINEFKRSFNRLLTFCRENVDDAYSEFHEPTFAELAGESYMKMCDFISISSSFLNTVMADITKNAFDGRVTCLDDDIDNGVKLYSRVHYDECLHLLKSEAQRHKTNPAQNYTPEIWGEVSRVERNEYRRIAGNDFEGYPTENFDRASIKPIVKELRLSVGLIKKFEDISIDGELWCHHRDADKASLVSRVYNIIDADNFLVYCYFALRHNIIQCEMHPELRDEFMAWMNGKDVQCGNSNEQWLRGFIEEHFVKQINNTYEWYALYRFLHDRQLLPKKRPGMKDFVMLMREWFVDAKIQCQQSETARYNFLGYWDAEEWLKIGKENLGKKTSLKGVRRIYEVYMQLVREVEEEGAR